MRDIPWLATILDVPADATWPRFMTPPPANAAGSYGEQFEAWALDRVGARLRWWQRLTARRVLEHDSTGALLWPEWLLTVARQCGKSTLLRLLALWRLHQSGLMGEQQMILHVANTLLNATEVGGPAIAWAKGLRGQQYLAWDSNSRRGVQHPDGSRWLIVAPRNAYGLSAGLVFVDEAWQLLPQVVSNGIEPTQVERLQPQLALLSTADPGATALFVDRRLQALGGSGSLLLEWSAPPWLDPGDRTGWRMASPHWSAQREKLVARKYRDAVSGVSSRSLAEQDPLESFKSQWLNIWPSRSSSSASAKDEPLLDLATWDGLEAAGDIVGAMVFAVDDWAGISTAIAVAGRDAAGGVLVEAYEIRSRDQAYQWVDANSPGADSTLCVGRSLADDPQVIASSMPVDVMEATGGDTKAALSLLRQVVNRHGLHWSGDGVLSQQVHDCRVQVDRAGGLRVTTLAKSHLVRAAAWAVGAVEQQRRNAPNVW